MFRDKRLRDISIGLLLKITKSMHVTRFTFFFRETKLLVYARSLELYLPVGSVGSVQLAICIFFVKIGLVFFLKSEGEIIQKNIKNNWIYYT